LMIAISTSGLALFLDCEMVKDCRASFMFSILARIRTAQGRLRRLMNVFRTELEGEEKESEIQEPLFAWIFHTAQIML
jgi:hypothetical protein